MRTKQERVDVCNAAIRAIASHGRRFFSQDSSRFERMENPRISRFELDARGRIWFIDKFTQARIFVARKYWDRGFSDGGTLHGIVCCLRDYIQDEKNTVPFDVICIGRHWGYEPSEMAEVRRKVVAIFNGEKAAT